MMTMVFNEARATGTTTTSGTTNGIVLSGTGTTTTATGAWVRGACLKIGVQGEWLVVKSGYKNSCVHK